MPYKIMMSIVATVPLIFLLAFAAIPEFFVLKSYPSAEGVLVSSGNRNNLSVRYVWYAIYGCVYCISIQKR